MIKKVKFWVILFVLLTQYSIAWAEGVEIYLYPRPKPKQEGNVGPTKAPARCRVPMHAFFDEDNSKIIINDSYNGLFGYCIYDENGVIVLQGTLDFGLCDTLYIDISGFYCGEYSIVISHNNITYIGSFNI